MLSFKKILQSNTLSLKRLHPNLFAKITNSSLKEKRMTFLLDEYKIKVSYLQKLFIYHIDSMLFITYCQYASHLHLIQIQYFYYLPKQ